MGLRITTWNVNGIRNPFGYKPWSTKRTFDTMFEILEADIVIMQELKIQRKDLMDDMVLVPGWDCFFSLPKHKKGYSGVGIYTRQSKCQPIRAEEGLLGVLCPPKSNTPYRDLPEEESIGGYLSMGEIADLGVDAATLDSEGRCVVLEFPAFVLFGVYCPANTRGDEMGTLFRAAFWDALDLRIRKLDRMGKRVILTGDLNNVPNELDMAGAEEEKIKEGVSHAEFVSTPRCRLFNHMIEQGEVFGPRDEGREQPVLYDVCRAFHPNRKGMYTHWDQKKNCRPGNFGSRIDFILVSKSMKTWATDSNIQEGLLGSDHCPVYAVFGDSVLVGDEGRHLLDIMNPPGVFSAGLRIQEVQVKPTLAFSARLLPEFDVGQRRNIKDMFKRQPSAKQALVVGQHAPASSPASPARPMADTASTTDPTQKVQPTNGSAENSPIKVVAITGKRKSLESTGPKGKKARVNGPANSIGKGQGSLKSFFMAQSPKKPSLSQEASITEDQTDESQGALKAGDSILAAVTVEQLQDVGHRNSASQDLDSNTPIRDSEAAALNAENEDEIDPQPPPDLTRAAQKRIDSSEQWGKLLRKAQPPLCEDHEEPCKVLQTKKKGANCGRSFYICPRPVGPSGDKEKGTQWRCRTFIWASDWNGGTGSG